MLYIVCMYIYVYVYVYVYVYIHETIIALPGMNKPHLAMYTNYTYNNNIEVCIL